MTSLAPDDFRDHIVVEMNRASRNTNSSQALKAVVDQFFKNKFLTDLRDDALQIKFGGGYYMVRVVGPDEFATWHNKNVGGSSLVDYSAGSKRDGAQLLQDILEFGNTRLK
jgi:hypothetical protein